MFRYIVIIEVRGQRINILIIMDRYYSNNFLNKIIKPTVVFLLIIIERYYNTEQ